MFYWLKLIRAFDERLSILVKQGKVRSGVYTGIGQEAIIVGTCFGLRKEDYICPLHRDLGAFLMKGVEPRVMMAQMFAQDDRAVEGPRLGAAQRRAPSSASSATPACSARTCRSPPASRSPSRWRRSTTSSSPTSAKARATSATSTRRSTSPACSGCRSSSSARTTSTPTRCRSRRAWRSTTSPIAPKSYGFDGVAINGNDVLAVYQATQGALARAREPAKARR